MAVSIGCISLGNCQLIRCNDGGAILPLFQSVFQRFPLSLTKSHHFFYSIPKHLYYLTYKFRVLASVCRENPFPKVRFTARNRRFFSRAPWAVRLAPLLVLNRVSQILFIFLFGGTLFLIPSFVYAAQVTLAWSPSVGSVAGYRVHYGITSGAYNYSVDVGNSTSCTISGLNEGTTYYYAVTAYDLDNYESDYSEELAHSVSSPLPSEGVLDSKFQEELVTNNAAYYTDRVYELTDVPSKYIGMDMIKTPNDDRNLTAAGDYLTFEMPYDGTVYVAYDGRATGIPNWMSGFSDTGDVIHTSLQTQPYLKVYSKTYNSGTRVSLGTNRAKGFSGKTVSNYIVFYCEGK